jgi:ABC-type antimicrobial peptide transport system permease subunit
MRLSPQMSLHKAIAKVQNVFHDHDPSTPFDFKFVNEEYARKFMDEERIGTLATVFAALAVIISCLGIFGLASFVAEQRTKEIGVRKVLGASVMRLWAMLSREFVMLVMLSLTVAMPLAWYIMSHWLKQYTYRTEISWWIFAAAGAGALLVTLLTVSYQSIRAARANPVKSLRME